MEKAQFGMIGLGTMGRNFLLNVAEQGFSCVGFDIDPGKRELLLAEAAGLAIDTAGDVAGFVAKLAAPRAVMLLVPAGPIVDSVINDLVPHLEPGGLIIDGGNSHYPDTARRESYLNERGLKFLGVGVSGGEEGARHGASIMIGGDASVYERVRPIFEAVAAKVDGEPCAAHVGSGSAGHFVKMVHNGIEYAMMQLIAETYDGTRTPNDGTRTPNDGTRTPPSASYAAALFARWNTGRLNSFLIEITATVLNKIDAETNRPLVDLILDTAGQKGTGKWTSQAAMDLGVPVPSIDAAVTMRQISAQKELRTKLSTNHLSLSTENIIPTADVFESALYASFIAAYTQGFAMLRAASAEFEYELDMAEIAKIWRGGCIIRAALLENIRRAFTAEPDLETLLLSPHFANEIADSLADLRTVASTAATAGVPAMAFAATLNYITAFTTTRLPANLIQAQRDYFGAHTYQRTDREGTFHTDDW